MQVKSKITELDLQFLVAIVTDAEQASIYMEETPLRYLHLKQLKEEVGIKLYKVSNHFKNFGKKEFSITFNQHQLEALDKVVETLFLDDETFNLYRKVYLKMQEAVHRYNQGLLAEMLHRQYTTNQSNQLNQATNESPTPTLLNTTH
jgi:hypothetical protein